MIKGTKKMYRCVNGPLTGIALALCTPTTMVFSIGSETGRYRPAVEMLTVERASGRTHEVSRDIYHPGSHGHKIISRKLTFSDKVVGSKFIFWEAA